mmetsp:Transcript_51324/g.59976  ORF Transcript_51324/g.59976 Transcript_51324/m.59976 type:complete len:457 (-) Transcript_51324:954-2324(-)
MGAIQLKKTKKTGNQKRHYLWIIMFILSISVICALWLNLRVISTEIQLASNKRKLPKKRRLISFKEPRYASSNDIQLILDGKVTLVDIHIGPNSIQGAGEDTYGLIEASFCKVQFEHHKSDPSSYPMFRDLVAASDDCLDKSKITIPDLKFVVQEARKRDLDTTQPFVKAIPPRGFVFHESRCGSTLVANSLIAANPTAHRVYSESPPPVAVMRLCEKQPLNKSCIGQAAALLRDVIYMMGRTQDSKETALFFKIQSAGAAGIPVFQKAFPDVPWIFVYRDSVEVMMSYLNTHGVLSNCMKSSRAPSKLYHKLAHERFGINDWEQLSVEQRCALHLAALCEAAAASMKHSHNGRLVNYADLPNILLEDIFPHHFQIPTGPDVVDRVEQVCTQYSKQSVRVANKGRLWDSSMGDAEEKQELATPVVKRAAELGLKPTFDVLEHLSGRVFIPLTEMQV